VNRSNQRGKRRWGITWTGEKKTTTKVKVFAAERSKAVGGKKETNATHNSTLSNGGITSILGGPQPRGQCGKGGQKRGSELSGEGITKKGILAPTPKGRRSVQWRLGNER